VRRTAIARDSELWPGFVDGLSALLIVLLFLLLVFALGQFVLAERLGFSERSLGTLAAERARLAEGLRLAEEELRRLRALLAALSEEKTRLKAEAEGREKALQESLAALAAALQAEAQEKARLADALSSSELRLAELAARIAALEALLAAKEREIAERAAAIEALEGRLNRLLAERVRELERYRSEFFGRLREVLGGREEVRIVGDRFVIGSEILFPSGSDQLTEQGLAELSRLAEVLSEVASRIPPDLPWVLQVDGHTDRRPIRTARFPSNWELSTARAVAVVRHLIARGIPAERLAAAGFGEHHPLDPGADEAALARNRRIEFKLTSR
jgi:chemotaxis protein MotB